MSEPQTQSMSVREASRFQNATRSTPSAVTNFRIASEAETPVTKMKSGCVQSRMPNPVEAAPGDSNAVSE